MSEAGSELDKATKSVNDAISAKQKADAAAAAAANASRSQSSPSGSSRSGSGHSGRNGSNGYGSNRGWSGNSNTGNGSGGSKKQTNGWDYTKYRDSHGNPATPCKGSDCNWEIEIGS